MSDVSLHRIVCGWNVRASREHAANKAQRIVQWDKPTGPLPAHGE